MSRAQALCLVCAHGTAGGTTRWSWLACTHCRAVETALQEWLGMRVLPLGRHSILNGVALAVATASPEEADAFGVRFEGLGVGWSRLFDWGDAEARRLAGGVVSPRPDVPLDVWQRLFRPSLPASLDAYERILERRSRLPCITGSCSTGGGADARVHRRQSRARRALGGRVPAVRVPLRGPAGLPAADQVADEHAGAVHPELDEPEDFP